jgi:hypothetical protein
MSLDVTPVVAFYDAKACHFFGHHLDRLTPLRLPTEQNSSLMIAFNRLSPEPLDTGIASNSHDRNKVI